MFIYKYFIEPMMSKTGYNPVNTVAYASIAIITLYLLYKYLIDKYDIKIDKYFIYGAVSFVLLGSTKRVITDLVDNGVIKPITPIHEWVLDSHLYDYNFFNISPGIYLFVGILFLISFLLFWKFNNVKNLYKFGLVLWVTQIVILLPFMKYAIPAGTPVIILALISAGIGYIVLKKPLPTLVVFSQALDGGATFFSIDYGHFITGISYFEQHVVSRGICNLFNTCFTFYAVKTILAILVVYLVDKENLKENEKNFIYLILIIIGMAPGLRDILRLICGG